MNWWYLLSLWFSLQRCLNGLPTVNSNTRLKSNQITIAEFDTSAFILSSTKIFSLYSPRLLRSDRSKQDSLHPWHWNQVHIKWRQFFREALPSVTASLWSLLDKRGEHVAHNGWKKTVDTDSVASPWWLEPHDRFRPRHLPHASGVACAEFENVTDLIPRVQSSRLSFPSGEFRHELTDINVFCSKVNLGWHSVMTVACFIGTDYCIAAVLDLKQVRDNLNIFRKIYWTRDSEAAHETNQDSLFSCHAAIRP